MFIPSISDAYEQRAKEALRQAVPFGDIPPKTNHRRDVGCFASSFAPENPLEDILQPKKPGIDHGLLKDDHLRYCIMPVPVSQGIPIGRSLGLFDDPPRIFFDEVVHVPALHFKDGGSWDTWMSLTPWEMWTQRSGISAATGHVVLGGLGMGWLLTQIAKKPTVKKITVVEKSQSLLDWFGYKVCRKIPKVDQVVCADFWEQAVKYDAKKCRFIADIWAEYGAAENSQELAELRAKGAKVWAWGSARPTDYQRWKIEKIKKGWDEAALAAAKGLGG